MRSYPSLQSLLNDGDVSSDHRQSLSTLLDTYNTVLLITEHPASVTLFKYLAYRTGIRIESRDDVDPLTGPIFVQFSPTAAYHIRPIN